MRGARGHSLVEVMVAGLVILAGIIPAGFAVASGIRLATRGRLRAEAALAIMSRIEVLRSIAGRSSAHCAGLTSGMVTLGGREEQWVVGGTVLVREVTIRVRIPHPLAAIADSVTVSLRCP